MIFTNILYYETIFINKILLIKMFLLIKTLFFVYANGIYLIVALSYIVA